MNKLLVGSGTTLNLYSACLHAVVGGEYKLLGFASSFLRIARGFPTTLKALFLSVKVFVLPTIHRTYNNDNKINYLIII